VWGFDMDERLLAAARLRAGESRLDNVTFVHGNVAKIDDVAPLPDGVFDLVLSRRGPNVDNVMGKLKPEAFVIQELFQSFPGLLEIFGRKSFLAEVGANPRWLVEAYSALDLFPVSAKDYVFETYFRDIDHLAAYLAQHTALYEWPLPPMPYEAARDRAALELYARYNQTLMGIRVLNHRKVTLFRRTPVLYAPVDPGIRPMRD
jgi:SAM-dependent methyltransferase